MERKGGGGSKQNPEKNQDVPVTKGELSNEITRIMSKHMPTIVAQSQENLGRPKKLGKLQKRLRKRKRQMKMLRGGEKQWKIRELQRSKKEKERLNKIGKTQKMLKD